MRNFLKIVIVSVSINFFHSTTMKCQSFVNGSFENWGVPNTCETNTPPDGWTNFSSGCVAVDEINSVLCPTTIPLTASNGSVFARSCCGWWAQGEGISQNVNDLIVGKEYFISIDYAGCNAFGNSTDTISWHIFIDNADLFQTPFFSSSKSTWSTYSLSFTATNSNHNFGFRCYGKDNSGMGSGNGAIDNIGLSFITDVASETAPDYSVELYPTIIQNFVTVKVSINSNYEVYWYDVMFNPCKSMSFDHSRIIDLSDLMPGIYFCVIKQNDKPLKRIRVIKQ